MKKILFFISFCGVIPFKSIAQDKPVLSVFDKTIENNQYVDWLVHPISTKAGVFTSADKKDIILYNGLVRRTFRISPNVACIDYTNLTTNQQLIRAVSPEAKITVDGKEYNVGGLNGQKEKA